MPRASLTFEIPDHITDDVRAQLATELARLHTRGYTVRQLITATGKPAKWVNSLLVEAGVNLPANKAAKPRPKAAPTKARQKTTATLAPPKRTPPRTDYSTDTSASTQVAARKTGRMDEFNIVLGDEMRALRLSRRLTRRQLKARLPCRDISMQTLATYELGTRQVPAIRVYQICEALDERVDELYARVRQRLQLSHPPTELTLDLAATADVQDLNLPPVQAWAQAKLSAQPTERRAQLTMPALHNLAALCAVSADELVERLTRAGLTKVIGSTHSGTTRHKYADVS